MSKAKKQKQIWTKNRLKREMERASIAMKPYRALAMSSEGANAMLKLSFMTQLVVNGLETEVALLGAIQSASDLTGIPATALNAHVSGTRCIFEFIADLVGEGDE